MMTDVPWTRGVRKVPYRYVHVLGVLTRFNSKTNNIKTMIQFFFVSKLQLVESLKAKFNLFCMKY